MDYDNECTEYPIIRVNLSSQWYWTVCLSMWQQFLLFRDLEQKKWEPRLYLYKEILLLHQAKICDSFFLLILPSIWKLSAIKKHVAIKKEKNPYITYCITLCHELRIFVALFIKCFIINVLFFLMTGTLWFECLSCPCYNVMNVNVKKKSYLSLFSYGIAGCFWWFLRQRRL